MERQEKGSKYIEDIVNQNQHTTGEGMRPICIPSTLDPFGTCSLCIVVHCKFLDGLFQSGLDQGRVVTEESYEPESVLWEGVWWAVRREYNGSVGQSTCCIECVLNVLFTIS